MNQSEEIIKIDDINGLTYVRNFISQDEHDILLEKIDSQPWLGDLQRRVQHYGYKYDYVQHKINRDMYIAPLPDWALNIATKLHEHYSETLPDQVIVNEYEPGQGIANHTDCKTCFRDTIISLSLGSECIMDFTHPSLNQTSILLEPRSLIIMQGEARYNWRHGIAKRKSDKFQGQVIKRARRVSLTFRTVIIPDYCP
ncbi:alpha-ketoglutarate-dependent dioxygenase AlkB [Calothrix sp. HK-06]|nr:alpha-ketoglutarate-dependent dioxygenase AlkB [Calothrix sp. HK-06]